MSIARVTPVVGSLFALLRNRLGLNVETPLAAQEISATVAPDRRLVVLGTTPIAGFARDHGTVADEAAMLALHTLDSTTILAEPTFVAPGDSVLRADDPGWRWHCITNHGQALADWERRPLAGALTGLAVSGHTHTLASLTEVVAALGGKQTASANLSTLSAVVSTTGGRNLLAIATPSVPRIPQLNADGTVTLIDVPSGGDSGGGGISADLAVCAWAERVSAAGGTLGPLSVVRAESLMSVLRTSGTLPHVRLMLPLLGANIHAALQPIVDRVGCRPINAGFVDADFSEAIGLRGGSGKLVHLMVRPIDLGIWACGGLGYWELDMPATGDCEVFGGYRSSSDNRFSLFLRTTTPRQLFWWGDPTPTNSGSTTEAAVNGHYLGQRSSGLAGGCILYRDGAQVGSASTGADAAPGADIVEVTLMGTTFTDTRTVSSYHTGRCGLAYMTDGTLTAAEVSALHTALAGWMSAVGRVG